jgi:hypothetical protein
MRVPTFLTTMSRSDPAAAQVDKVAHAADTKAFRGELVPQDSADEPAAVMLERLRSARKEDDTPRSNRRPVEFHEHGKCITDLSIGFSTTPPREDRDQIQAAVRRRRGFPTRAAVRKHRCGPEQPLTVVGSD